MIPKTDQRDTGGDAAGDLESGGFRATRTGRRLAAAIAARADHDETDPPVLWTRAWVSRDGRYPLLAARYRDFVVVTERRLLLWSCGFFSRRPRTIVFDHARADLAVRDSGNGRSRHLRVETPLGKPLRLDVDHRHAMELAVALTASGDEEDPCRS